MKSFSPSSKAPWVTLLFLNAVLFAFCAAAAFTNESRGSALFNAFTAGVNLGMIFNCVMMLRQNRLFDAMNEVVTRSLQLNEELMKATVHMVSPYDAPPTSPDRLH